MIDYLPDEGPPTRRDGDRIEYVNGPRSGEREAMIERPPSIAADGGSYRRSVACADDGAVRYIWVPDALGTR